MILSCSSVDDISPSMNRRAVSGKTTTGDM